MTTIRRLQKELQQLNNEPISGVTINVNDDNMLEWKCSIKAAHDSPYKGGTFHFDVKFPENFPFKAPSVTFTTRIYHPGINEEGAVCVPVLRNEWKPSISIASVLSIIQDKLNNPSSDDPYEPDIAALMKTDHAAFLAKAKEFTKKYAM